MDPGRPAHCILSVSAGAHNRRVAGVMDADAEISCAVVPGIVFGVHYYQLAQGFARVSLSI